MLQQIYIIDDNVDTVNMLNEIFKNEEDYEFHSINSYDIDTAIISIPALFILNEDSLNIDIKKIITKIRENDDNSITPIIVLSSNTDESHKLEVLKMLVEFYIVKPANEEYLYYTIKNIIRLMYTNRTVSPLTGLPGNIQIQAELKKRIKRNELFFVLYFDLDNFKAYNDVYGFINGDRIIKFTADTIFKNIHLNQNKHDFIGHIGGDDFVAIVDGNADYEKICQNIISEFDTKVKAFFTEEDAKRGYLKVQNRKGKMENFPLTAISIGVVRVEPENFSNVLEIGEIGAQVKHLAKKYKGSCYAIDRRKH